MGNFGIQTEKGLITFFGRKVAQAMPRNHAGQAGDDGVKQMLVDLEGVSDLKTLKNLLIALKNEVD